MPEITRCYPREPGLSLAPSLLFDAGRSHTEKKVTATTFVLCPISVLPLSLYAAIWIGLSCGMLSYCWQNAAISVGLHHRNQRPFLFGQGSGVLLSRVLMVISRFNSLWCRPVPTLVQVMVWCLTAPSHYLKQCWIIISDALWHSNMTNFTISQVIILYNKFECYTFKITLIYPRGQ